MAYRLLIVETDSIERILRKADIKWPTLSANISPTWENHHAHTCSAFARLQLRGVGGAHKWYQYPRVTCIGHLKAAVGIPIGSRRRTPVHRVNR